MNYIYKGIIAFLIIPLLLSCETKKKKFIPPSFEKNEDLKYQVLQGTLIIGTSNYMVSFDNYIVIRTLMDGKWLHVYDTQTGKHLGGYVGKGQGPGEMTLCTSLYYNNKERLLTMLDANSQQCFIYRISDDSDNLIIFESKKSFSINRRIHTIFMIDENHYLLDGRNPAKPDQRFSLLTKTGVEVSKYNDFATSNKIDDDFYAYLGQDISTSPNRKKMACVTHIGAVLETFEISDSINLIQKKLFYPIFLKGQDYTENTVFGFSAICTSDEYIYTVLIGSKDFTRRNNISVFNWNGDPVVRFTTDIIIRNICYNEDDNSIYAVAETEEYEYILVKFDISDYL